MGVAIGRRVDDDLQAFPLGWRSAGSSVRTAVDGADVSGGIGRGTPVGDLVKLAFVVA